MRADERLTTIQGLMLPEVDAAEDVGVYVHLNGQAGYSADNQNVSFKAGGLADLGTYANLFNLARWRTHCDLKDLAVRISGTGRFEVQVVSMEAVSRSRVVQQCHVELNSTEAQLLPIVIADYEATGTLHITIRAITDGLIKAIDWVTQTPPFRIPTLLMSVTTYRREEVVHATAEKFKNYLDHSTLREHLHLLVVDNGQTVQIEEASKISVVRNKNFGGSGGFARGLLEAQKLGFSHCLFMDDDASIHLSAIERTWAFLAFARDDKTAVAGALAQSMDPQQLWENGALFHKTCLPLDGGTDLGDITQVFKLEQKSAETRPDNFYGGWWFFAFPIRHVQHLPFPFFVRGDDVSFSLVHDFNCVTLNGVMSHQDEDFSTKETPLTVYLDLRSHLVHHLALERMDIGRLGILWIIQRFYFRALLPCHYETLAASNLALTDVLQGPDFFRGNAEMSSQRQKIAQLQKAESWRNSTEEERAAVAAYGDGTIKSKFWRAVMMHSMNGHLLPGIKFWGKRVVLPARVRTHQQPIWAALHITYVTSDGTRAYTVAHSKKQALLQTLQTLGAALQFIWRYHALRSAWRKGYEGLTTAEFWEKQLGLSEHPTGQTDREEDHAKNL